MKVMSAWRFRWSRIEGCRTFGVQCGYMWFMMVTSGRKMCSIFCKLYELIQLKYKNKRHFKKNKEFFLRDGMLYVCISYGRVDFVWAWNASCVPLIDICDIIVVWKKCSMVVDVYLCVRPKSYYSDDANRNTMLFLHLIRHP